MNVERIWEIVSGTTTEFRKGAAVTVEQRTGVTVAHVYAMPHVDEAPTALTLRDVHFIVVGVDAEAAQRERDELAALLADWPDGRIARGPSYIEAGAVVGDQGIALRLYALGDVLGFWNVITPESLGLGGVDADRVAGNGLIMVDGFRP